MERRGFRRGMLALAFIAVAAQAQMPSVPSGIKGIGLPNLSSMSAGNAAGVLGYCVKNKYVGGSDAKSVLNGLTKKPDVKSSDDYAAGEKGEIQTAGSTLSLDSIDDKMKSKTCGMVLKQAKSLL